MYREEGPTELLRRVPLLTAFLIVGTLGLFIRLWYLQVVKGAYYYELAENNSIRTVMLRPPRGIIYDRNGRPLVENVLTFDVSLVPEDAPDLDKAVALLAPVVQMSPEEITAELQDAAPIRTKYEPVKIREDAPWSMIAYVEAHQDDLPGVVIEPEHRRHYPYGSLAAHELGYLGKASPAQQRQQETTGLLIGQSGIEREFNGILSGSPGRRLIQVDAAGRRVKDLGVEEPRPGTDLFLTIDLDVQQVAEEALGKRAGAVVAMDPNTGQVLAIVSHPSYDPNLFPRGISARDWTRLADNPLHPLYNRAIQSAYPPGSTFKIVVALAGLETGVINPREKVLCSGYIVSGRRIFRCWDRKGHGLIALHRALVESCDVYFYTMGARIGFDRIGDFAKSLGLGSITGISLPDEKPGLIPTEEWKQQHFHQRWFEGDTFINSIGQGFTLVTPLQACVMMSAVANGGDVYRPLIVDKTRNRNTGEVDTVAPDLRRHVALDPTDLAIVRAALVDVVNGAGGTAHAAQSAMAVVAGKTGTAQVISEPIPGSKLRRKLKDHAWFVGYAPADHPLIAVAVLVEHGGHGGTSSAPIAKRVIEEYLQNVSQPLVQ